MRSLNSSPGFQSARNRLRPTSKIAWIAYYLLAVDIFLFVLQKLFGFLKLSWGQGLEGWVSFLSFVVIVLFTILAIRWLKAKLLWRLRNRLIVTYVFIGVIPVLMLVALALGSFYLFAGQFATFIVTTGLNAELKSLDAANSLLAHQLAAELDRGSYNPSVLEVLRRRGQPWTDRQICAWLDTKLILNSVPEGENTLPPTLPALKASFRNVVRDHDKLYLRVVEMLPVAGKDLVVLSSQPFDQRMLQDLATDLGAVSLYATGLTLHKTEQSQSKGGIQVRVSRPEGDYILDMSKLGPPTFSAGTVPPATRTFDRWLVPFPTTIAVVDWTTGDASAPALINVQTRFSKLYQRLFAALGDLAQGVEVILLTVAILFALIELVALIIGTQLTRTVTSAVAQLYEATKHINRGDFSHRIPVKSHDQIATLANSFNSMTASLEKLIEELEEQKEKQLEEQKEKQRLENELVIAQEVQSQLFPKEISQLARLEVHGFCRPARTVSGDYYDFLKLDSERLVLAVGDVSGKGISAALMMATIHSAVRAYSLQDIPALREPVAVAVGSDAIGPLASGFRGPEVSPAALLTLLNHQLFASTPAEKYATLFFGIYHATEQKLSYSNGGHLPPIILSRDGAIRRLECGGMVVGLFDSVNYEESSATLRPGEIFLAYSDGVTEPENDFGEFGEQRLVDLVRENLDLSLPRISEIVTAAVDDWIGADEQPDDVTLVLARARSGGAPYPH
jgi:phosphoserine phosphatase RsbU/P